MRFAPAILGCLLLMPALDAADWVERVASDVLRRNILNGAFTHPGVGVAMTEDGQTYFTQLFMLPKSDR